MKEETKTQLQSEVSHLTDKAVKLTKDAEYHLKQYRASVKELKRVEKRRDSIMTENPNLFN
ncbi:hypothetical protein [Bacillus sp. COPE52]|uniref:hypothetical protein n=1 Tax=Bacillus sp. COPE52 TaxID=2233998 RepID=UPI000E106933|nr:hypothetical protein [Bacillus sp. COPE52]AXK19143.1 hypothetical protein DPQ31_16160 [Bacillus sp. COPE52]